MITQFIKAISRVSFWFVINLLVLAAVLIFHFAPIIQPKPQWWPDVFAVSTNLLTGGAVSFLLYFLLVFIPERRKKNVIKTNLNASYLNIKRDILWQVVIASRKGGRNDISTDTVTIENLMNTQNFKDAFSGGHEGNEGFYAFENQMSDNTIEFQEIILLMRILSKQIDYVLNNYIIEDQKIFDFLKRLEIFIMHIEHREAGYDESKALCNFMYEIFAGFNIIDGWRNHDIIQKMVEDI